MLPKDDIVIQAIEMWLSIPGNIRRVIGLQDLYSELETLWPNTTAYDTYWPKSVNWFGRRVSSAERYLRTQHGLFTWRSQSGRQLQFLGKKPESHRVLSMFCTDS